MVASTIPDNSNAKAILHDRAFLMSSAEMHLIISLAQVRHLKETGSLPKEISDTINQLHNIIAEPSVAVPLRKAKPKSASITHQNPPVKVHAEFKNIPGTHQEVVARPGDPIIVYAWAESHTEAIAYSMRNKTFGRIPRDALNMSNPQNYEEDKMYMITRDVQNPFLGGVKLNAGDYVRVWNCEDGKDCRSTGMCFNLGSGKIGKFVTIKSTLQSID